MASRHSSAPRTLKTRLRRDPRFSELSLAARVVLLDAIVALSDYDGLVLTEYSYYDDDHKHHRHEGIRALAYLASLSVNQARRAVDELESAGLVRTGSWTKLDPSADILCEGYGLKQEEYTCGDLALQLDERLIRAAQARDRS